MSNHPGWDELGVPVEIDPDMQGNYAKTDAYYDEDGSPVVERVRVSPAAFQRGEQFLDETLWHEFEQHAVPILSGDQPIIQCDRCVLGQFDPVPVAQDALIHVSAYANTGAYALSIGDPAGAAWNFQMAATNAQTYWSWFKGTYITPTINAWSQ
jgi:hypothetical protein